MGCEAGHPQQAVRGCHLLLDTGFWREGGISSFSRWARFSETCITSIVLNVARWFRLDDPRLDRMAGDGGATIGPK